MAEQSNFITSTTEAIRSIPDLIDAILQALSEPYGWITLTAIAFWLFFNRNLLKFFSSHLNRENKRFEYISSYLEKSELANKLTLEAICDARDAHYFNQATGIFAERSRRESLILFHKKHSHHINWTHIRRALPYIETSNKQLISIRKMNASDIFGYYYNLITGFFCLLFSAAIFIAFITTQNPTPTSLLFVFLGIVLLSMLGLFVLSQTFPEQSAKKIEKLLFEESQ
ncbi:hypothetical protein [Pseudomonas indica]|uniref:Uncharacterized protein n=1 Tax=Pseudomonas indica TaxID=137658 RepID=A0A1G9HEW6_9PSED|nr:hypothetical protein [Pseudomonas indica]SDL11023.1 hypothetical protein SAMN05216186_1157 [Pseudomonas indica]